jgi:hypothetical protein
MCGFFYFSAFPPHLGSSKQCHDTGVKRYPKCSLKIKYFTVNTSISLPVEL